MKLNSSPKSLVYSPVASPINVLNLYVFKASAKKLALENVLGPIKTQLVPSKKFFGFMGCVNSDSRSSIMD